jgi:hypothetical protein
MNINHKFKVMSLVSALIFLGFCNFTSAQGFKGIIPLESTCEDVKRILRVDGCKFPRSVYWLKDYTIDISFNEKRSVESKICYKVPKGRVISLVVSYNKNIPIKEFEYELKFVKKLNNDIDSIVYENEQNNISVLTQLGFVSTAIFIPTQEQHKKFAFECKKSNK